MNSDLVYTLLIIGEEDAGKNIFLLRFTDKEIYRPIQFRIEFKITRITINDSIIKLKIWDAPGQEKFRTRTNKFLIATEESSLFIILIYQNLICKQ